jgi:hypothetical protein
MQAIMETIFDIAYLATVISLGLIMYAKAKRTQRDGVNVFGTGH